MNIIDPLALSEAERKQALLALAQRWTDLFIDLSSGERPLGHALDTQIVAGMAQPFAHPLLTVERVADMMGVLHACLADADRFRDFGTWDGENDDSLGCRNEDERTEFLAEQVEWALFRLLRGAEPCRECVRTLSTSEVWMPSLHGSLCFLHGGQPLLDHRPLHAGTATVTELRPLS